MEDLIVNVGADIGSFLTKIDAAKAKVGQLTERQGELKDVIKDLNKSISINERELTSLNVKLQKVNTTTAEGKTAAANFRKEIAQVSGNAKNLADSLGSAKKELVNTTASLKKSTTELKNAEKASGGFAGGIKSAYSGLRTLANIIPGLGISGIFLVAFEAIKGFADAIGSTNSGLESLKRAQESLNVAMAEAGGSVAGEVVQLRSLVSIAKDTSLSYAARTEAVKQLNKEYPELHGNITLENIGTDKITKAINTEIEAIKRRSQAKALEKLIDEESVKLEKVKAEGMKGQISGFENFINKTAKFLGAPGLLSNASGDLNDYVTEVTDATNKIEAYSKKLNELNVESAKTGTLFTEPLKKSKKDLETIGDVLKKLRHDINTNITTGDLLGLDKSKDNIGLLSAAISHLVDKFNNSPERQGALLKVGIELDEAQLAERLKQRTTGVGEVATATFEVPLTINTKHITKAFAKAKKEVLPEVIKFGEDVSAVLNNMNAEIAAGIGQSIGDAISGKGDFAKELFGSIFQTLGNALQQLGKVAIETGIGIKAIKAAFKTLNPYVAIAAGVGLIALGAIIKNSVAGAAKFASGGFVRGPGTKTSDSISARLSAGEYVIKADSVSKYGRAFFDMINGGSARPKRGGYANGGAVSGGNIGGGFALAISGEFELRGDRLVAVVARAEKRIGRNG